MSVETAAQPERHSTYEDVIAIVVGTMFMAVSYTHLDVYKRQRFTFLFWKPL